MAIAADEEAAMRDHLFGQYLGAAGELTMLRLASTVASRGGAGAEQFETDEPDCIQFKSPLCMGGLTQSIAPAATTVHCLLDCHCCHCHCHDDHCHCQ